MTVFRKMVCFVDTRGLTGGIEDREHGWTEIEFIDADTNKTFTPESITIKLDYAQTYLEYSFSAGNEKVIHGRLYNIGNAAPPNGPGQESKDEGNELATKIFLRATGTDAVARIWARKG